MVSRFSRRSVMRLMATGAAGLVIPNLLGARAHAAVPALKQSIAEAASRNEALAAFYRARNFEPIFTGPKDTRRRAALLKALQRAGDHGLPQQRYDAADLMDVFGAVKTARDQGRAEVEAAARFVAYADDLRSGVITPRQVDGGLVREPVRYDTVSTLEAFIATSPSRFLRKLAPNAPEYARLQKEKFKLEKLLAQGGWGDPVQGGALKPNASGQSVVQLRNRLIRMGYLRRTATQVYNGVLRKAVEKFQTAHGLPVDGEAGPETLKEINKTVETRLEQVLVAMERQRWHNTPLEQKYVWVNIPDFHVDIMENGRSTFRSRVVVGKNTSDRRTPEFSDTMEFMIINPSWYVPRSIVTKEYLPLLQRNPNAAGQLLITDRNGRQINRAAVNFSRYNARNFPYSMRQPPSSSNALGLVKFMFPNKHNIYLHDTPAKALFGRDQRAFSHGCVRVHQPFDFAYALLSAQESDPERFFQRALGTGSERRVDLNAPLPVHLVYYTAWVDAKGRANYRRDVYGRDARIFAEMSRAGVSLDPVQS